MTGPDRDDELLDLYRATARETPDASADAAVMATARNHLARRRVAPFVALAAGLVIAVLAVRAWAPPTPGAAPAETRAYLMQLETAPGEAG